MVAAVLWTPAIVGASMMLGQRVLRYYEAFETHALWVVLAIMGMHASIYLMGIAGFLMTMLPFAVVLIEPRRLDRAA